jgi:hypothetical protein
MKVLCAEAEAHETIFAPNKEYIQGYSHKTTT